MEVAAKSPDSKGYQLGSSRATVTVHGWSLLVIATGCACCKIRELKPIDH
jgi:hypothetical protein